MPRSIWLLIFFIIIILATYISCQNQPAGQPDAPIDSQPEAVQLSTVSERIDLFIAEHPILEPQQILTAAPIRREVPEEEIEALKEIMSDATLEEITDLMFHDNDYVSGTAENLSYGRGAEFAPYLVDYLLSDEIELRGRACMILPVYGSDAVGIAAELVPYLEDDDIDIVLSIAYCLAYIDPDILDAVPFLLDQFENSNEFRYRDSAFRILTRLNLPADEWIPFFIDLLEDEEETIRSGAAYKLGLFGPVAAEVLPLIRELRDTTESLGSRHAFTEAIEGIEGAGLDYYLDIFENTSDPSERRRAFSHINQSDLPADEWVPFFAGLLLDEDIYISSIAAWLLLEYGQEAETALPQMREAVETCQDEGIRERLEEAIALIEGQEIVK